MSWYKKAKRGRICDWDRFFINQDHKVSASIDFYNNEEREFFGKMKKHFDKRTNMHIDLVAKYSKKIAEYDDKFKDLLDRIKDHDQSKFKEPEFESYVWTTWNYKCKDDGKKFEIPEDMKDMMTKATEHHVKTNSHHPEFHCDQTANLINKDDRDKPPEEMIDSTKMPDLDIAEMIADWCSVSEERKTNPKDWADKNVNVRWKFNDSQKALIYELIEEIW